MNSSSTQCKVLSCHQCQEDTEFYCRSCMVDLCVLCKEQHVTDLSTKEHNVIIYREKNEYIQTEKMSAKHSDIIYERYNVSVDLKSTDLQKERNVCVLKREHQQELIDFIRSDVLFYRRFLLLCIRSDVETFHNEISHCRSEMLRKAKTIKIRFDDILDSISSEYGSLLNKIILKQRVKTIRHIAKMQMYEEKYELSGNIPLRCFKFRMNILHSKLQKRHILVQHSQLCFNDTLNREDVVDLLSKIKMNETKERSISVDRMLKIIYPSVLHENLSTSVATLNCCLHISCLPDDKVWICDKSKLVLMDTRGVVHHRLNDIWNPVHITGLHSVNWKQELIYINSDSNLIKLSKDTKTKSIFFKREKSKWRPQCVVCSHLSGDVLVGIWELLTDTGKIIRFNSTGEVKGTIEKDKNNDNLYKNPMYITENSNGDIVVSDWNRSLVVTDCGGRHRFSYTGHPTGSGLSPCGTCTDVFSNILVCDNKTHTVQLIDKDGTFMHFLLTGSDEILEPWGLGYDINSHLLWVGSYNNNVVNVHRYINRRDILIG